MIKGLIFDLDGTITNTLPLCISSFRRAIEPLARKSLTDEEIVATFGPSEEGTILALAPDFYQEGLHSYLMEYDAGIGEQFGPLPHMLEWLDELQQQGIRLALVTGKGVGSTELTMKHFELHRYFDFIKTGSPTGPIKEQRIKEILDAWLLPKEQVAYVGDAPSDITAAKNVGIKMISVDWLTPGTKLDHLNPDVIVHSIDEAKLWINRQVSLSSLA